MRRAAKVDANHGEIVEALLSVSGVKVHSLAGIGGGCPYLLIGARGLSFLAEVKNPNKLNGNQLLNPESAEVDQGVDRERRGDSLGRWQGEKLGATNRRRAFNPRGLVWTG